MMRRGGERVMPWMRKNCENVWLLGLINCDNLVADCLVARHLASQERSANNQVIRSLDD